MHDLVTLGEVLLRLAIPSPTRFETARQLDLQFGGAEANVAAACARLGLRAAWISALPANPWGERIRRELAGHGVDCGLVRMTDGARVGVYFLEYGVPPRPVRVLYDRRDSAFARLTAAQVDWEPVRRARLVHLTGITPALGEAPRSLVERALAEASTVSFDINYRATLWSPAEARAFLEPVLTRVRYLFIGQTEAQTLFGFAGSPEQTLASLARLAPKATISLQRGEEGSTVLDGGRCRHRQDHRHRPPHRVAHRAKEGSPRGDPRAHVHRQGGGRDGRARRHPRAVRVRRRRDLDLSRVRRSDPA